MPIPLRVLIVEDTPDDAEMMVLRLTDEGFQPEWRRVQTEADYLAALETNPDLILADWSLPQFSGLRALQLMNARGRRIPFIIVSGSIGEEPAVEALRQGANDYVLKDRPARLGRAVRRALEDIQQRAERKLAGEALRLSEEKYRTLVNEVNDGFYVTDSAGVFTFTNPALARIFGFDSPEALVGRKITDFVAPELQGGLSQAYQSAMQIGHDLEVMNGQIERPDGTRAAIEIKSVYVVEAGQIAGSRGVVRDVTERKQAEETLRHRLAELEALHTVSTALRTAQTRDEALPILLDEMLAALETSTGIIWLYDPDRDELRAAVARGWFSQLSETPIKPGEGIAGTVFASGQAYLSTEFRSDPLSGATTHAQIPAGLSGACVPIRSGEVAVGVLFISMPPPRQITPEQAKLLESLTEIAGASLHRMNLHEATVRQLDQLRSLHDIDLAITASMDLRITLNVLLSHVLTQLKVDAADVMLLNPRLQTLEYAAGHGFRTDALINTRLRLGAEYAGRAALERKLVHIPDLRLGEPDFLHSPFFSIEGFVAYYGMPLIVKGQVKGVLEIFHRAPLPARPDWVNLLETLAEQAAIAIDNAQLFSDLQRSNIELALAYDATIEGWSHALDLRDKETEGHSLRVTELTLRLAKAMGTGDDELVHIRRGALLHDIGKLGVPDRILLKSEPLTDDEWAWMRKHPQLAFDMLAPIAYLKPALDIPYCHHEKWDGTGYPRGLKGEQIPLAARLFAVVDVWDALTSDRPYRKAWSKEEALDHLRAQAGKHFDPKAVELFMRVLNEKAQEQMPGAG